MVITVVTEIVGRQSLNANYLPAILTEIINHNLFNNQNIALFDYYNDE